jgi:hypothetical protein
VSHHRRAGKNHKIKTVNKETYFEYIVKLRYLETTVNQNYMHEENMSRSNSGTALFNNIPHKQVQQDWSLTSAFGMNCTNATSVTMVIYKQPNS